MWGNRWMDSDLEMNKKGPSKNPINQIESILFGFEKVPVEILLAGSTITQGRKLKGFETLRIQFKYVWENNLRK